MDKEIKEILSLFEEINKIPRCSRREENISRWLINWACEHKLESKRDRYNNVLIEIPPSKGYEDRESIAIQGHMDMVCEKSINSKHNFSTDPIKLVYNGEWLTADNTTLGADDGIALAIGLALALNKNIRHPKLELLFTTGEEIGLIGASHLEPGFFKSKTLINIDSEDEGVLIIGCAGGEDTTIRIDLEKEPADSDFYKLSVSGLLGGHSGIDINKHRANAIKIMAQLLKDIRKRFSIKLMDLNGGSARNAIPSYCEAIVAFKEKETGHIKDFISKFKNVIKEEYKEEHQLDINLLKIDKSSGLVLSEMSFNNILNILSELPHGVYEMSADDTHLVKTSNNLARVKIINNIIEISTNQRSLTASGLDEITKKIESIAEAYSASYVTDNRYPSWTPNKNSKLLKKGIETYEKLFFKKPKIEAIHAGLECGVIGSKADDIDMISIGPTIRYPHTPNERVNIDSIGKIWKFLLMLLSD